MLEEAPASVSHFLDCGPGLFFRVSESFSRLTDHFKLRLVGVEGTSLGTLALFRSE